MASNGKRPHSEPARNFSAFRTCGPIRRQRLPSTEDPLSDLDYDYGSSSDDGEWSTSTGSESMDMDMYDTEEEEMMLLDALEEEEELEEEEATDDEMDYVDFSTDEEDDSEFEEEMDRELARVEMEMYRKQQRKKLIPPEMIPDGIDSDDEEAWQFLEDEWMCEQEQLLLLEQQQQNEANSKCAQDPDVPDWDALDAINRRFLIRGNVAGKPCTMTSSVGVRRARISMLGTIVPATEMLRNFFRDARRNVGGVKENTGKVVPVASKKVASVTPQTLVWSNGSGGQRKALSERNL